MVGVSGGGGGGSESSSSLLALQVAVRVFNATAGRRRSVTVFSMACLMICGKSAGVFLRSNRCADFVVVVAVVVVDVVAVEPFELLQFATMLPGVWSSALAVFLAFAAAATAAAALLLLRDFRLFLPKWVLRWFCCGCCY